MGYCVCEKSTGLIEDYAKWDKIDHDPSTHIQLVVAVKPDRATQRWDGDLGFRATTTQELADATAAENTAKASAALTPEIELMIDYLFGKVPALRSEFSDMKELKAGMLSHIINKM